LLFKKAFHWILSVINFLISSVLIGIIKLYRISLSPLLGSRCIYYPSCSAYASDAIRVMGAGKGTVAAALRIFRCNGLFLGGSDEITEQLSYLELLNKYKEHWYAAAVKEEQKRKNTE
jgi:putative membrane protein insertion efficiency factor